MFDNIADTDERGQVGIGTLIVFIAMVLVAAIAAGVLINTAGLLQSQAESTGQESTDQVANNLQVVSAIGETDADDEIEDLQLTVALAPGSGSVDLDQVNVTVTGDLRSDDDDDNLFSGELTDSGETETENLLGDGDGALDDNLPEGDTIQITLTTGDGSQTTKVVTAPNIIESDKSYNL